MGSAYAAIPGMTGAIGQNNTTGGKAGFQSPFGGNGMSIGNAQRILDPLGIGGGGGMNKGAAEAFLDPLGIDSSSMGLNLFGQRGAQDPNGLGGVPTTLPNLGAASMIPQTPGGAFQRPNLAGNPFQDMAARSAGPLFSPQGNVMGGPSGKGGIPNYQPDRRIPMPIQRHPMDGSNIQNLMQRFGNLTGGGR